MKAKTIRTLALPLFLLTAHSAMAGTSKIKKLQNRKSQTEQAASQSGKKSNISNKNANKTQIEDLKEVVENKNQEEKSTTDKLLHLASKKETWILLAVASIGGAYYYPTVITDAAFNILAIPTLGWDMVKWIMSFTRGTGTPGQ